MVPAALANSGEGRFAQAHFEFMAENHPHDQFLPVAASALAGGHRRWKYVGWMGWVLLPVNIVVVHAADHQRIRQRGRHRIHLLTAADHSRWPAPGDFIQNFESDDHVVLAISAE